MKKQTIHSKKQFVLFPDSDIKQIETATDEIICDHCNLKKKHSIYTEFRNTVICNECYEEAKFFNDHPEIM